jgi:ribA/ribD-fused uncharacterized protein
MNKQQRGEWLREIRQTADRLEGEGRSLGVLVFEGNQPAADEVHLLSQWACTAFVADGVFYPTLTHFLMAGRAEVFGSATARLRILRARGPREAEALGYQVKAPSESSWATLLETLLDRGTLCKAIQNDSVQRVLLASAEAVIVSAGLADDLMGVGLRRDDARVSRPSQWQGQNLLGLALMDVRERLRGGIQRLDAEIATVSAELGLSGGAGVRTGG